MAEKEKVRELFDDIAPTYDKLNHLLSLNIDKIWRKKAIKQLNKEKVKKLLDVACGTGDFAIMACKNGIPKIVGIDISDNMLDVGNKKIAALGMQEKIHLQQGDSENICFEEETFDAVTVAFGVRNFEHLDKGLKEMNRVLKKGGKVVILEFSMPSSFPMKQLYSFYFKYILPTIGGLISKNKQAYQYLPDSVSKFPQGNNFLQIMQECGFHDVVCKKLTFGIASIYTGVK
ncbi:MAG: bifunctional demethylmenaquinone methyltransferase/2-methoxy-6-polyprenyl-1,4-benzoquinol methylase UbiE [Dysgonamonadaceae bacterium]|jgi:demethylmenaquinone methyltransferase/2-methoxy-6-polyprenyl-1,4-benzoquinol methylase|nr:bifunctional demethylmenaquinone methyltransferase/2-methoxy-6-polyprenyl-1,4-benzoquinol methylase UbiE [Dysgonamonadaceae bacterium]